MSGTLHATCVAIGGRGVLLLGPPGAGKSDLALRLIDRGAVLVADDGTAVEDRGGRAIASAPATIAGLIEMRGVGILPLPHAPAPLALVVRLGGEGERLPPDPLPVTDVAGTALPTVSLDAFAASAPLKVELALKHLVP